VKAVPLLAQRCAASRAPLPRQGEAGTDRDRLAAATRRTSPDPDPRFVALDRAALPHEPIADDLFGRVDGPSPTPTALALVAGSNTCNR
jgi:transcriptional regulator of aromatic amino acid metabolism